MPPRGFVLGVPGMLTRMLTVQTGPQVAVVKRPDAKSSLSLKGVRELSSPEKRSRRGHEVLLSSSRRDSLQKGLCGMHRMTAQEGGDKTNV